LERRLGAAECRQEHIRIMQNNSSHPYQHMTQPERLLPWKRIAPPAGRPSGETTRLHAHRVTPVM
jgi:hypothetical protein